MEVLPVDLRLVPVASAPRDLVLTAVGPTGGRCATCDAPLVWHQPAVEDPDRLLGVCPGCGAWHLLQIRFESGEAVFVQLPGDRHLFPPTPTGACAAACPGPNPGRGAVAPGDVHLGPGRGPIRVAYFTLTR